MPQRRATPSRPPSAASTRPAQRRHRRPGPVLLGADFSPAGEPALDEAIRQALLRGSTLLVVHALTPLGAPGLQLARPTTDAAANESADVTATARGANQPPAPAEAWLRKARQAGVTCQLVTSPFSPARAILAEAVRAGVQLVVVGSRGRPAMVRDVLGSVAHEVAVHSPVPVLVVPASATSRTRRAARAMTPLGTPGSR